VLTASVLYASNRCFAEMRTFVTAVFFAMFSS
jgi:hypothetical protein